MAQFPSPSLPVDAVQATRLAQPFAVPKSAAVEELQAQPIDALPAAALTPSRVSSTPTPEFAEASAVHRPASVNAEVVCSRCGGSGRLRVNDDSFRTCLDCLGQGVLPGLAGQASLADWIAPANLQVI